LFILKILAVLKHAKFNLIKIILLSFLPDKIQL
jgi:hypothetical protein